MPDRASAADGTRPHRAIQATLVSWPFLVSLIVLLANDVYLKYAFPGFVTGKLSDFAGILLVALVSFAALPRWKLLSALTIGVLFLVWKSPASQPLIDWINSAGTTKFGRVVDYSDLLALLVIPLAWSYSDRLRAREPSGTARRLASIPVALLALIAVTGTSYVHPMRDFILRDSAPDPQVDAIDVFRTVQRVARRYESSCPDCDATAEENSFRGGDVMFHYQTDQETGETRFFVRLEKTPRFLMFSDFDHELLQEAIMDLKNEFATLSRDMEYVEKLSEPARRHPHDL